ncbi:MAG TPA: PQQ-dependent sugar dehydrogenase [Thermodesulfobacteriota bacterium]|nr:PQQ-dependent sugar dehydrogenase [Thermodesulfobacteriota bacterium]
MNNFSSLIYRARVFASLFVVLAAFYHPSTADESNDWRSEWSLDDNFDISIDTEGYSLPSAIAFVTDPGKDPKAPLYFVLELRGKVKVVTNDRSIYTFAEDFFKFTPAQELPSFSGENGLAGICLDPENGYVFVTFVYQDENNILRNNIARFDSIPGTFSLKPQSMTAFTDIFSREGSSPSHQIGPCQVSGGNLFVGVGDGFDIRYSKEHDYNRSQDKNSLLGKILRMTLDGKPVRSNPYYIDDDITKARNYVWAVGFRNPFGLKIVDGRVFVADNGLAVDRFVEVHKGGNYLWDGTDISIGTNADVVFMPATGVTQLDFYPEDLSIFPERYRGKFYQALCGSPDDDPVLYNGRRVEVLDFGFERNELISPPFTFLRYRGSGLQSLVGLAIGPDGLYFAPIMPISDGRSVVFKVSYDPEAKHRYTLTNEKSAPILLEERACFSCHMYGEAGWGTSGPNLDSNALFSRVSERLDDGMYGDRVRKLDSLDAEPYKSYREERAEVMQKKGVEKVRAWVKFHIMEPKFDNPDSGMPNLGVSEEEAEVITFYLVPEAPDLLARVRIEFKKMIPVLRYRYLVYSFLMGFAIALVIAGGYTLIKKQK